LSKENNPKENEKKNKAISKTKRKIYPQKLNLKVKNKSEKSKLKQKED